MLQKGQLKKEPKRTEKILIRVTPEVKKRWATTVFVFVGRKGKRFKTVNDLLEDMIKKYAPIITIKHG